MADNLTKSQRSYNMSRIRAEKTAPELRIKPLMAKLGFAYQPKLYGRPDFVNKETKTAVFVDGCFWHRCPKHFKQAKSNKAYWVKKINSNVIRDKAINKYYKGLKWTVVRIWEHEIKTGAFKAKLRRNLGIHIDR
jgi:DNA mismatch endonuclease (patch repair protein)